MVPWRPFLFPPALGNNVVVVEIVVLRDVAGHPVTCAAQYEQIEDAVVDRGAALGFPAEVQVPEARPKFRDQARRRSLIVEPGLYVEVVTGDGRFHRARVAVGEYAGPVPVAQLALGIELAGRRKCAKGRLKCREGRKN